jgi:hypothetical protein
VLVVAPYAVTVPLAFVVSERFDPGRPRVLSL